MAPKQDSLVSVGIEKWGMRIGETRKAIEANGDEVPPIDLTEGNYAPDGRQ